MVHPHAATNKKRAVADDALKPDAKQPRGDPAPIVLYTHSPDATLVEYDLLNASGGWTEIVQTVVDEARPKLVHHPKLGTQCGSKDNRKDLHMRRSCGFFADPKDSYGYFFSKQLMASIPPTNAMIVLMALVSERIGSEVNGILINEYADGDEYIAAHADNERGLANTGVFAISYGAERTFRIRDKTTKKIVCDAPTRHMRALFMRGSEFQKQLTHEIPKRATSKTRRISLTFRLHNKANEAEDFTKHCAKNGQTN